MTTSSPFPAGALEWLVGPLPISILLIGSSAHVPTLRRSGHDTTVIDEPRAVPGIALRYPDAHIAAASTEALPFDPAVFDLVLAIGNFHSSQPTLALAEWARVLRPGGHVGLAYLKRDDSIPWVRKLRSIVQSYLPGAMAADALLETPEAMRVHPAYALVEQKSYRVWVPSTRRQLQDSARTAVGADDLDAASEGAMAAQIGALYDEYARAPDPLMLPYELRCWRAETDALHLATATPLPRGLTISY